MNYSKLTTCPTVRRNALTLSLVATLLIGCGGGGDTATGGSPTSGSKVAVGAVSGFGSIYIDGVRYDDAYAETAVEDASGNRTATRLELGQRVRAIHDGLGKATRLLVEAAVIGDVMAVDGSAGKLTVAAQVVRVNTDPVQGPVTRFGGGYESLASIAVDDDVEVHGSPIYDSVAKRYEIQATRVARLGSRSHYRVVGTAAAVDADSFDLNGLTVTYASDAITPAGATLTEGASVVVYGTQRVGTTLTARAVRVRHAEADAPVARTEVTLGGFISAWDAGASQFVVDGQGVRLGGVVPTPANATPQVGAYVKVAGVMAEDGLVDARRVNIRTTAADDELALIRLTGEITDLVEGTAFLVRGVPVDASAVTPAAGCPSPLVDGTLVSVRASAQADTDVVLASEIQCPTASARHPREVADQGVLWPVNTIAQTFRINDVRTGRSLTVRWDDNTAFLGLPRPGSSEVEIQMIRSVHVEGYQEGDLIVARVVRDINVAAGQRDSDRFRRDADPADKPHSWLTYQQQRRP